MTPTIITTGTRVRALSHLGEKILDTHPLFNVLGTVTETLKWPGASGERQFRVRFDNRRVLWFSAGEVERIDPKPDAAPQSTQAKEATR